jgi:hypothetical protein
MQQPYMSGVYERVELARSVEGDDAVAALSTRPFDSAPLLPPPNAWPSPYAMPERTRGGLERLFSAWARRTQPQTAAWCETFDIPTVDGLADLLLRTYVKTLGVTVQLNDEIDGIDACFGVMGDRILVILSNRLSPDTRVLTLLHCLSHVGCGDVVGPLYQPYLEGDTFRRPRTPEELAAEERARVWLREQLPTWRKDVSAQEQPILAHVLAVLDEGTRPCGYLGRAQNRVNRLLDRLSRRSAERHHS